MKFPIIVFEKDDKIMYALDYPFLMGDKRFIDVGFKKVTMIDSHGNVFNVDGVLQDSGLLLWQSIKLAGLIVKLKPIIKGDVGKIRLETLKERVMRHVKSNSANWSSIDAPNRIERRVEKAKNFEELIRIFK